MEQQIFEISFTFKGQAYKAEARTLMPNGPELAEHEIWLNGNYLITITPHEDIVKGLCWRSKEPNVDWEFVTVIGDAIERYYL